MEKDSQNRLTFPQAGMATPLLTEGLIHDFNNLLQIILGNAGTLAHELRDSTAYAKRLALIVKAAEKGTALTRTMLDIASGCINDTESVDVNPAIRQMKEALCCFLGESVALELLLEEGLPHVVIDKTRFESCLFNLALNARDAMPNGGTFGLRTAAHYQKGRTYVVIDAIDSGTGIPFETQRRIFDPFFTTKGKGTGLGLSQVSDFAEQAGGFVRLFSAPGHGSVFRLYIPSERRA